MAKLRRGWGIVLSAKDVQETDRLATVLTEKEGKVPILAKRARRIESPYGAVLEPTNYVELIYYVRVGPYLLKEASLLRRYPGISGELARLEAALEGLNFVEGLLPERVPEPRVLSLTVGFLEELEKGAPPDVLLLAYELKALSALGHGPHLEGCVRCGSEEDLTWSPGEGLICRSCGGEGEEMPASLWRAMRMLSRLPLSSAGRVRLREGEVKRIRALLRGHGRGDYNPA